MVNVFILQSLLLFYVCNSIYNKGISVVSYQKQVTFFDTPTSIVGMCCFYDVSKGRVIAAATFDMLILTTVNDLYKADA